MKAIHGRTPASILVALHRCAIQTIRKCAASKAPGSKKIVFRSSSIDGRLSLAIDKKHIVALAPPAILILQNRHGHADKMSPAGGFHPHIIAVAIYVFLSINQRIAVLFTLLG